MPITSENLPKHELIGLQVEISKSTDEKLEDFQGEVMDETESMLRIDDKWVEKKICTFVFEIPDGRNVEIGGELIAKKPEERTSMRLPDKWG